MPELLKMNEVCEYLRVSKQKGYRLIWSGAIPSHKVGNHRRVKRDDLVIYLDRQTRQKVVASC